MEKDFYELAKKIYKKDIYYEKHNMPKIDFLARLEYAKFCVWCRAFKCGNFCEENFKEYQEKEHLNLDFWTKKRIAELFYDYEFEFDYDTIKWKSHKKSH